jgi:hypothetical protein
MEEKENKDSEQFYECSYKIKRKAAAGPRFRISNNARPIAAPGPHCLFVFAVPRRRVNLLLVPFDR